MKVHIIEDEPLLQETISFYLKNEGFEVSKSLSGDKAVEETLAASPDAIVLDIMLPGKSGYEVLSELRQKNCQAPVIVYTNLSNEELDQKKLDELGVRWILLKVEADFQDLSDKLLQLGVLKR